MPAMDDPATWPFKLLPLVKRVPGGLFPECGLLRPGYGATVFLLGLHETSPAGLASCVTAHYRDFAELRADGWAVD